MTELFITRYDETKNCGSMADVMHLANDLTSDKTKDHCLKIEALERELYEIKAGIALLLSNQNMVGLSPFCCDANIHSILQAKIP